MRKLLLPFVAIFAVVPAAAQRYEFGVGGGGSFYTTKEVTNARGNADAGFKPGFALTAHLGNDMYEHVGGEVRYTYLHNDMKLEGSGGKATFGAEAHTVHYDFLIHSARRGSSLRPYVAVGGGFKFFRGTGTEVISQPLANIALLTRTNETVGMISFGGGVKLRLSNKLAFRVDVHDYFAPLPKNLITPNVGSRVGGWLHNIVPTAAIVFTK